ncbi:MAG: hypothetical protein JWN75_1204 [Candidatus Saccharibacteria bacterium]|nr:hypothetical protein [Candidatus Saccharibacteria bacterium]
MVPTLMVTTANTWADRGQDQIVRDFEIGMALLIARAIDAGITPERLINSLDQRVDFEKRTNAERIQRERFY